MYRHFSFIRNIFISSNDSYIDNNLSILVYMNGYLSILPFSLNKLPRHTRSSNSSILSLSNAMLHTVFSFFLLKVIIFVLLTLILKPIHFMLVSSLINILCKSLIDFAVTTWSFVNVNLHTCTVPRSTTSSSKISILRHLSITFVY